MDIQIRWDGAECTASWINDEGGQTEVKSPKVSFVLEEVRRAIAAKS